MTKESVSILSTLVNLGLAAKSSALLAEGLHSGIDVFSSGVTFIGLKIAKKEPTKKHPYGWEQAEVLAGLVVTALLGLAGAQIIRDATGNLSAGEHGTKITLLPLLVMIASVVVNEVWR